MKIRTIKPEFWMDELVATWPPFSRMAYIALWNEADDSGRLRASPVYLKSKLFPYDLDLDMNATLRPIVESGRLVTYEVDGQTYGFLPNFLRHQVIARPTRSRLPDPPATNSELHCQNSVGAVNCNVLTMQNSVETLHCNVLTMQNSAGAANQNSVGKEGKGREGKGKEASADADDVEFPPALNTPEFARAWEEWVEYRKQIRHKLSPATMEKQLQSLADMGPAKAIASINNSITQGWQGLFPPKESANDQCETVEQAASRICRQIREGAPV